jgi:hypothetical protein
MEDGRIDRKHLQEEFLRYRPTPAVTDYLWLGIDASNIARPYAKTSAERKGPKRTSCGGDVVETVACQRGALVGSERPARRAVTLGINWFLRNLADSMRSRCPDFFYCFVNRPRSNGRSVRRTGKIKSVTRPRNCMISIGHVGMLSRTSS